jgi:hypothetical protein
MQYSVYDGCVQTRLMQDPEMDCGKLAVLLHRAEVPASYLENPPSLLGPCGFTEGQPSTSTQSIPNKLLRYLNFSCGVFYNSQYF